MNNSTSTTERPAFKKEKPTLVFKIFFDPESGRCSHKTTGENIGNFPFLVVDYQTYSEITVCSNYVVNKGQLEKVKPEATYKKLSKISGGNYRTTKNNMIFIVTKDFTGPVDTWDFRRNGF